LKGREAYCVGNACRQDNGRRQCGRARYGNSGSGQGKAGIEYNARRLARKPCRQPGQRIEEVRTQEAGRRGTHGGQLWQSSRAKQDMVHTYVGKEASRVMSAGRHDGRSR
jgi:hypothetical protein